jgi:hypothetical protein
MASCAVLTRVGEMKSCSAPQALPEEKMAMLGKKNEGLKK